MGLKEECRIEAGKREHSAFFFHIEKTSEIPKPKFVNSHRKNRIRFFGFSYHKQKMLQATRPNQLCCHLGGQVLAKRFAGSAGSPGKIYHVNRIGNREVVGFGMNGRPGYSDNPAFPFPAIKFREMTPEFKALEEKAKGDWKNLTIAEKKQLYRINYCQTFAEMDAPTGQWKSVVGCGLMLVSLGVWLYLFVEYQRSFDGRVETLSEDRRKAQLRRILDLKMDPVDGISSKWDYEKNMWKKDVARLSKEQ